MLLVAGVPADPKRGGTGARGVAFCTSQPVNVRLTNGTVVLRRHVIPGRTVKTVVKGTKDLLLAVRIKASWPTVQKGQTLRITADGPNQEQWTWRVRIR